MPYSRNKIGDLVICDEGNTWDGIICEYLGPYNIERDIFELKIVEYPKSWSEDDAAEWEDEFGYSFGEIVKLNSDAFSLYKKVKGKDLTYGRALSILDKQNV